MNSTKSTILDELVRAGAHLSRQQSFRNLISVLVEQAMDISRSDLAALYIKNDPEAPLAPLKLSYKRGKYEIPGQISGHSEVSRFLEECGEGVVITEKIETPFKDIFLNPMMESAVAFPVSTPVAFLGILFLNARKGRFFNREKFNFLESFTKLAGGMLHNARLFLELKEYLKKIEELERYQSSIFSSMTNILVTTDKLGKVKYFNYAAEKALGLEETHLGQEFRQVFRKRLTPSIMNRIEEGGRKEFLGLEGIIKNEGARDMDFSLNITPLIGKRGHSEGVTLLFTDQTRERELQDQMNQVVEERRLIKDMFSRYLSEELVQQLVNEPDLVRPFGAKKEATIFFADIRGYTSFSEGKDPEYIIEILNAYFREAVEIVIRNKGYIDKFIGDCIMAAWGVPLQTIADDAVNAVTCALEIQKLVASQERQFFKGKAEGLKIGIGMHTGSLVAGNLGSRRRMDYTVIGDTVNVAARLEGVARAGEVIITENTRSYLGDRFLLEQRDAVKVKGKALPIQIFAVLDRLK